MTWILPKQLISAFAPDTEALTSDSAELSQICEQSLMRRSKHSPAKTYLREWKADNLMRLRSGVISSPSLGKSFLDWWTSSLADTHANRSQPQENGLEQKILATSGPTSQTAFDFSDLGSASLRTSKDISAWGCPTLSKTWQEWVTEQRGAYSQRLNAELHTRESGSSSWPSPVASEVRQGFQDRSRGMKGSQESLTTVVIKQSGHPVPASSSTDGSRPGLSQEGRLWMTPKSGACGMTATTSGRPLERATQLTTQVHVVEKQWQTATVSTGAHRQKDGSMIDKLDQQVKSWATPQAQEAGAKVETLFTKNGDPAFPGQRAYRKTPSGKMVLQSQTINQQVEMVEKSWPTPASAGVTGGPTGLAGGAGNREKLAKMLPDAEARAMGCGKLNPRWVCTLMNVPVFWVKP